MENPCESPGPLRLSSKGERCAPFPSQKKYEFQKKIWVPKKVWVPKKGTHTFGSFFAATFFSFSVQTKKKIPGKTDFAGTLFFV